MARPLRPFVLLVASILLLVVAACVSPGKYRDVELARTALLGLTADDLRMCAGFPSRTVEENGTSIWSYEAGDNRAGGISLTAPILLGAATTNVNLRPAGSCKAQFRIVHGRIDRIAYAGDNDTPGGADTLCTPIIDDCLTYARRYGKGSLPPAPPPDAPDPVSSE